MMVPFLILYLLNRWFPAFSYDQEKTQGKTPEAKELPADATSLAYNK